MESSDATNATASTNLLKLEKVRTKTRYTNLSRSLLAAIANDVSKEDIKEQLRSIEKAMNDALAVINQLASAYAELKLHGLMDSVVEEAQDLETSYTMAVTQASETLYSMSGYNSSRSSCSLRYSRNQEKVHSYFAQKAGKLSIFLTEPEVRSRKRRKSRKGRKSGKSGKRQQKVRKHRRAKGRSFEEAD